MYRNTPWSLLFVAAVMLALPSTATAAPAVSASSHEVSVDSAGVVIESVIVSATLEQGAIELAHPLPATAVLEGADVYRDDAGRVVAIHYPGHNSEITCRTYAAFDLTRRHEVLPIPIATGDALHRVEVDPDLNFLADESLGVVATLGYHAPPGVSEFDRRRLDRALDGRAGAHFGAYYVRGNDVASARGFTGRIEHVTAKRRRVAIFVGLGFALLAIALALAHRLLRNRVRLEAAHRLLDEEFAALEDDSLTS